MKFKKALALLVVITLLALCSCSQGNATNTVDTTKATDLLAVTDDIKAIQKRGFLRVGCKNDVPGFSLYNSETKQYEGGEIELAYRLAAKIFDVNINDAKSKQLCKFTPLNANEREKALNENKVDCVIATYTITNERKKKIEFSQSYYKSSIGIMVNISGKGSQSLGDENIRSVADLDGKKIGIVKMSTTREDFYKYIQATDLSVNPVFFEFDTYAQLSKALQSKTVDAFSVDTTILQGYLTSSREILSERFGVQNYGVAAKKGNIGITNYSSFVIKETEKSGIALF